MREAWCSFSSSNFKLQNFYYELKLFPEIDLAANRTLNIHEAHLEVSSSDELDFEAQFV